MTASMARRRRAKRRAIASTTALLAGVLAIGASVGWLVYSVERFSEGIDLNVNFPSTVETSFAPKAMGGRVPRWSTSTAGSFSSAPVVAGNRVYVRAGHGDVDAFDAGTGAAIWSVQVGGSPFGIADFAPVVVDGVVYATGGDVTDIPPYGTSSNAAVYALDAATGARRWTTPVGGLGGFPLTVAGELVYVDADLFMALDRVTGAPRWSAPVGNHRTAGYSQPAVAGEGVYVGGGNGRVYAFDRTTGTPRWTAPVTVPSGIGAGPNVTATDQLLYVTSPDARLDVLGRATGAGHLRALDPATGAARWVQPVGGVHDFGSRPTLDGGTVYVPGSVLSALDATTGVRRWRARTGGSTIFSFAPLTVTGGIVYLPGGDGRLHALDARSGISRWTAGARPPHGRSSALEQLIPVPPAVAGGVIYLGSGDRHLYAYAAQ